MCIHTIYNNFQLTLQFYLLNQQFFFYDWGERETFFLRPLSADAGGTRLCGSIYTSIICFGEDVLRILIID